MARRSHQQRKAPRSEIAPAEQAPTRPGPRLWLVALLLAVFICGLYVPVLNVPFIFDDRNGIADNNSILHLWPLVGPAGQPGPLNPGPDLPSSPRPLVNLSLAVNYALGGFSPYGYHVYSLALHYLTALLLWAFIRRTLLLPYFGGRFDSSAGWLALAVAMLWALHPLVTETVIYATQRSEQMMTLFYIATLHCSLRYWQAAPADTTADAMPDAAPQPARSRDRAVWCGLAIGACLAGMASKEVMVSAPLMALLYERTFITGSIPKALRRSWPLYLGLAATWILLLIVSLRAPYGTAAGFKAGVPAVHYWLTQAKVILIYLKLCFWPSPLLIHYELPYFQSLGEAWLYVLPVIALGIVTLVLLWRNHPAGWLGTLVFAILAPTSVIPIRLEMAAERRMYLPLVAILVLVVVGGYYLTQRSTNNAKPSRPFIEPSPWWALISAAVVVVGFAFIGMSSKRLTTYNSEMALWQEVLQYQPHNLVAHNNLGLILTNAGRIQESIAELKATLAIKPDYLYALNNLGNAYSAAGQLPEAVESLKEAVRVDPNYFQARNNLGIALLRSGRIPEAIEQLQEARRLESGNLQLRVNLGSALANSGRLQESIDEYEAVLAIEPDNVLALINSSISLARAGRVPEAIERVQHALRLDPKNSDAHTNLGLYLSNTGQTKPAAEQFGAALELNPNDVNAHYHYGNLLAGEGRANDAIPHFQQALRLQPNFPDAYSSLGAALQKAGHTAEAVEAYEAALKYAPVVPSYANLAQAYRLANRPQDAIATAQKAIDLANANNHPETAAQVQDWLAKYRAELAEKGNAASAGSTGSGKP